MLPESPAQSAPPHSAESPSVAGVTRPDVSRYASYSRLSFEAHDNGVLLITLSLAIGLTTNLDLGVSLPSFFFYSPPPPSPPETAARRNHSFCAIYYTHRH